MAEVYQAYQPSLDRHVAIKVLHAFLADEENFLTRFQREAKAVARLRHPNVVQVHDFDYDEDRGLYYMVMEFINGSSLKEKIEELAERGEGMSLCEAVRIVTAVGEALSYAHRQGMVHRDIKPANIMFNEDGEVILTDFGIVKMIDRRGLTASGAMVGTPAYISPELGMGEAGNEQSDIYSLGVVLYQLVTGSLPFEAETPMGIALKHINESLPDPRDIRPDLPDELAQVLLRSLAKDPADRYESAEDFVADLRQVPIDSEAPGPALQARAATPPVPSSSAQQKPSSSTEPSAPRSRSRVAVWSIIGAMVALLLLLGGGWTLVSRGYLDEWLGGLIGRLTVEGTRTPDYAATQIAGTMRAIQATMGAPTNTPEPTSTPTSAPTYTPTPTATPDRTATAWAACVFDMEVVNDYAVWPRVLTPGQKFVKRWRIENVGTCIWPEDVTLTFASGDEFDVIEKSTLEPLATEDTTVVRFVLEAPSSYGTHTGAWQLKSQGKPIGEELVVSCRVGPTPTPRPTATPTALPTSAFTPTPYEELWMSRPGLIECGEGGNTVGWGFGGGMSENYRYFYGQVIPEQELAGPYNSFEGFPHVVTYFTASGELTFPVLDECGRGMYGHCGGPEVGYEIVWQEIYKTRDDCPE